MQVVGSSETGKNKKIYHKVNCMYAKRIKHENRVDMNPQKAESRHYCECKYCGGLKGDIRTSKKQIQLWETRNNIKLNYHDKTDTLYVQTEVGFWKIFRNESDGKYLLYHRNVYRKDMSFGKDSHGNYHRQRDVKATDSMTNLIEYIIAHDKAKIIIQENYHNLPKDSKKNRKFYKQAKRRAKRQEIRRVEALFEMIEKETPKLKKVIFC